jgi:hypothetical protein
MAKNDVVRVSAPNTTKAEKARRDAIKARQDAELAAEMEHYKKMFDPNNQSAEAMAMRDGPIKSLIPEVLGMVAMNAPVKAAMKALIPVAKPFVTAPVRTITHRSVLVKPKPTLAEMRSGTVAVPDGFAYREVGENAVRDMMRTGKVLGPKGTVNGGGKGTVFWSEGRPWGVGSRAHGKGAVILKTPVKNVASGRLANASEVEVIERQMAAKGGDTRLSNERGKAAETFDTPIPKKLKTKYDAWYAQLPKNLQYTGDYDLQGTWLERLGQPDKYEEAQNGHLDDYGKKPNHITFSTGSKWHDPKVPERTGGEWKQAEDGSWDFYPGTGNKASDDELKAYFDKYEKGNRVHRREVRQDWGGGNNRVDKGGRAARAAEGAGEPEGAREKKRVPSSYFGPMFDINQMALDAKGKTPTEALREFYGDKTEEVVSRALKLRMKYGGDGSTDTTAPVTRVFVTPPGSTRKVNRVKARLYGDQVDILSDIEKRLSPRGNLSSWISWITNRSYALRGSGKSHIARKGDAGHERLGHNLNPAVPRWPGGEGGRDVSDNENEIWLTTLHNLTGDMHTFYSERNPNEMAAALGNLRKSLYKRTNGAVDIAEKGVLEEVAEDFQNNPKAYDGPWLTDDARNLLANGFLSGYSLINFANQSTQERSEEVYDLLRDPEYLQQHVNNKRTRQDSRTIRADQNGDMRADTKGGDTRSANKAAETFDSAGPETAVSEAPVSDAPAQTNGPRIVINPTTFRNSKDALCVAFNEGFRVWMEANDFQPQSEPTDRQRKFFSDTAYADDEVQLRRTILARIATFDTSVKDPTDDQLSETGAFLDAILESPDWCKNEWERNCVSRLSEAVKASVGAEPVEPRPEPVEPRAPEPLQSKAALGGGETEDEATRRQNAIQFAEERGMDTEGFENMDIQTVESVYTVHDEQVQAASELSPETQTGQAQPQNAPQGQEPAGAQGAAQPQNAQGAAQPQNAQGAAQPGNGQVQPQNAAQGQEDPSQPKRQGAWSNIWSGGEEGKGRRLTTTEAEWMKKRIESGASVSGQQLSMFGLRRNERGGIVDGAGNAFNGFGEDENIPLPGPPDAKLDDRERKRRKA